MASINQPDRVHHHLGQQVQDLLARQEPLAGQVHQRGQLGLVMS